MTRSSAEYFDSLGGEWDRLREGFFSETIRVKAMDAAGVERGQTAVDVGAGTGFVTEGLVARGLRVIAVDRSRPMLEALRQKLESSAGIECRVGEAEQLPIEDETVDVCFANMLLHHVDDPPRAIREMRRIVRPGGRVVVTDLDLHDQQFLKTGHHDRWMGFDRGEVRRWLEQAGLAKVRVDGVGEECCAESCGGLTARVGVFIAIGRVRDLFEDR